ncbi:nucleoporin, Nup155-like, partial [Kipferlia bialata]|eukprot:g9205.t1
MYLVELPDMSAPLPVSVHSIASTDDGRVFLGTGDGCIHQLTYDSGSFFRKRCRTNNKTRGWAMRLVPSFLRIGGEGDPVIQLKVDKDRRMLFALTRRSRIHCFSISKEKLSKGGCLKNIQTASSGLFPAGTTLTADDTSIVSIETVPPSVSYSIHLIAVARSGCRYYISTTGRSSSQGAILTPPYSLALNPKTLRIAAVRQFLCNLPGQLSTCCISGGSMLASVHSAKASSKRSTSETEGVRSQVGRDNVVSFVALSRSDPVLPSDRRNQPPPLVETSQTLPLPNVVAITAYGTKSSASPTETSSLGQPKRFLCLSPAAVTVMSRQRPIERFIRSLSHPGLAMGEREREGEGEHQANPVETMCMCLQVLVQAGSSESPSLALPMSPSATGGVGPGVTTVCRQRVRQFLEQGLVGIDGAVLLLSRILGPIYDRQFLVDNDVKFK